MRIVPHWFLAYPCTAVLFSRWSGFPLRFWFLQSGSVRRFVSRVFARVRVRCLVLGCMSHAAVPSIVFQRAYDINIGSWVQQ